MHLSLTRDIFLETAEQIVGSILSKFDPNLPFRFMCYAANFEGKDALIDNSGLLDGVMGTFLSLFLYITTKPSAWTEIFLLN